MPPQNDISHASLLSELQSHNAYFDSVLKMIPASGDDGGGATIDPEYLKDENDIGASAHRENNTPHASRTEMLRAKLHAKIAETRAAAGIASHPTSSASGPGHANDAAVGIDTSTPVFVSKRAARKAERRKRREGVIQRNKGNIGASAERKSTDL